MIVRRLFLILLLVICGQSPLAAVSSELQGRYKNIPVFDNSKRESALSVSVKEVNHPLGLDDATLLSYRPESAEYRALAAEITIARYFSYVREKRNAEEFYQFYKLRSKSSKITDEMVARWHDMLVKYKKIIFLKKWYFADYQLVIFKLKSKGGADDPEDLILSFGAKEHDGQYRIYQDFEEHKPVSFLFWYMMKYLGQSVTLSEKVDHLKYKIVLSPAGPSSGDSAGQESLFVYFNAELYGDSASDTESEILNFFYQAKDKLRGKRDEAFLELWPEDEKFEVLQLKQQQPDRYKGLKDLTKKRFDGESMHLCTIDLDGFQLHYYRERRATSPVKMLLIKKEGGNYYLTNKLSTNIKRFMESDLVKAALLEMRATADSNGNMDRLRKTDQADKGLGRL